MKKVKPTIEYIKERASKMYLAGNPPSPKWWLDRIEEIIDKPF